MEIRLDHPIFRTVGDAADDLGLEAYVVGGYVRDLLLDRPSKDIDFVCVGSGIELARAVAHRLDGRPRVNYFKTFGTANIRHDGWEFEFVGARKESYRRDSRKPIVEEGTLEDDQNRRDFTINAMALSVNQAGFGVLVDPFDGVSDLEAGIIRTPRDPEVTFSDDPLRMMRAVRFATQLGFTIEPQTLGAIRTQADRIEIISQERITDELNKIVGAPRPSVGFRLLEETGLLALIFPEMNALKGREVRRGIGHKDNFYHTIQVLDNLAATSEDLWLRWAAILHDIGKPRTKRFEPGNGWTFHGHEVVGARMVKPIFRRLKLPMGEERAFVEKMVRLHLRPIPLSRHEISDSAIRRLLFDAGDDIDRLMLLCEADITSKNRKKVKRYLENFQVVRQKLVEIEEKDRVRNFQPPVSGEDIMEAFGIPPSRAVGDIKDAIKEAILDGRIENDVDQARALMLELGRDMGLRPVAEG